MTVENERGLMILLFDPKKINVWRDSSSTFVFRTSAFVVFKTMNVDFFAGEDIDDFWLPILWHLYKEQETNDTWSEDLIALFVRYGS